MVFNALAFLAGIMLLQNFVTLPKITIAMVLIICSAMVFIFKKIRAYTKLPILFIMGFAWCIIYVHMQMHWSIPDNLEGKTIKITGYIASIPEVSKQQIKFIFKLKNINGVPRNSLIHLSWQNPNIIFHPGDQWQFSVHLKKIHGTMNPGGFDYEAWCLQQGIRATGYIYHNEMKLIDSYLYRAPLQRFRQFMLTKIFAILPASNTSPWIAGLAIGIRQGISSENWQVLRSTGTNHLMAIAGLHIGIMCSLSYFLVNKLWRCVPRFMLLMPAQQVAGLAVILTAISYSALAGFSLPTQRACIMITLFFMVSLCRRNITVWHTWSLALLFVLINDPLSVLTESLWLSFGAVALIIYGVSGRLAPSGLWWKFGRIQWVLTLGLIPLSIWLFHECSMISFVANAIAIPWVGFIIVPLVLLGCFVILFSTKMAAMILLAADKLLAMLWNILTYLSHLSYATWYHVVPSISLLISACIGIVLLLLPIGFPGRWFGIFSLLPFILYKPSAPKVGEAWLTLLDVGQGLSAVIQTQNHTLVFDAGARLSDDFDMGDSVVVPFLQSIAAKKIDMLVVSHRDNDHSGGAKAILDKMRVLSIKSSSPELFVGFNAAYCLQHESWQWDNVEFEFLYPSYDHLGLDNDSSCVLKISTKYHQILLPGDIEKTAEKYLLSASRDQLKSDILIAPHHGSKTSAIDEFVQAVHPEFVLFPVGYRNRYHFPNLLVINKYQLLGANLYNSVTAGAIQFHLDHNAIAAPILYRFDHRHYWN